jgi:tetratricopeptide (TPR) repeat protein
MKGFMHSFTMSVALIAGVFAASTGFAADSGGSSREERRPVESDVSNANKAIKDKDWGRAVDLLTRAVARDDRNADLYNKLGYSERQRGNLDAAFKHYERALALDPKHRGVHEYVGEAYLMTGNLARAEEHLATLDKLCSFSCEEYRDLKTAITDYKQKQAAKK